MRGRVAAAFAGASLLPLGVLAALYFFDEFDTSAVNVLAPNIERAFHLDDRAFATIVVLNLSIVLLLSIPAGHLGDRAPRRLLAAASGIAAGLFSLLTGLVGSVGLLLAVRIGNGLGNLSNTTFQPSLLADYYPREARANVFAAYAAIPGVGAIAGGAVVGLLAGALGWRAPFFLFFLPIVLMGLLCLRLREPLRGESDDREAAQRASGLTPPKFLPAARRLWAVPTMRRLYIAFAFAGAGLIPLAFTLPLFYAHVYHLGAAGRGLLASINSALGLAGAITVGPLARRWLARNPGRPLRWVGLLVIVVGSLLVAIAAAPDIRLSIAFSCLAYYLAGMVAPPFNTVASLVAPPRIRTLAFALAALFGVAGVVLLYLVLPVAALVAARGVRWGLAVLAPYWVATGLVLIVTEPLVARDAEAARHSLAEAALAPEPA